MNNAGALGPVGLPALSELEQVAQVVTLNLGAAAMMAAAAVPLMMNGGAIVNLYAAAKADLRAAMAELGLREVTFGIDYLGSAVVVT